MRLELITLGVFVMISMLEEKVAGQCTKLQYSVNGVCVDCGCDWQTAWHLSCEPQSGKCGCKYDYTNRTCNDVKERKFKFDLLENPKDSSERKYYHITIECHGNCDIRGLRGEINSSRDPNYLLRMGASTEKWSINKEGRFFPNGDSICKDVSWGSPEVACLHGKGNGAIYTGTLTTAEFSIMFFSDFYLNGTEFKFKVGNFKQWQLTNLKDDPNRWG